MGAVTSKSQQVLASVEAGEIETACCVPWQSHRHGTQQYSMSMLSLCCRNRFTVMGSIALDQAV